MKTLRFFAGYMGRYFGCVAAFAAADILLTLLFGQSSLFATYLYIFSWIFCWIGNIALMQISGTYAQLALCFGATRRRVMAATAACWLGGAAAAVALGYGVSRAAVWLFPAGPGNHFLLLYTQVPPWRMFLQCLLGGAVGAWCAHLPQRGGWLALQVLLQIFLTFLPYCLLGMLPLIAAQPGWGWVNWVPAVSGAASLPFLALALRRQSRMAVTT